ncbi:hypothetical protein C8R44DRAFT_686627 [Mycena epipterygia]|nr:hypothetical protein C8R44DRAFT_686627 [Mycena epipterygia]
MLSIQSIWDLVKKILRRKKHPHPTDAQRLHTTQHFQRTLDVTDVTHAGNPPSPPRQISHIALIPPEILSEIFIFCHDQEVENPQEPHNIPVYLTQICSSWRHLALNTPDLWSSVSLYFSGEWAPSTRAIMKFADAWLARGRPRKLALRIHMLSMHESNDISLHKAPIGRLIAARAGGWQKISFTGCSDKMTQEIIAILAGTSFPSLEEIELETWASIWDTRFDALRTLPCLNCVHLRSVRTPSPPHDLTLLFLPWAQLKDLCIAAPISGRAFLEILPNCPELEIFQLHVLLDITARGLPIITLSKLSELSLTADTPPGGSGDVDSFLGALYLPSLDDLELCCVGCDAWNPLLSAFWERHATALQGLHVSNLDFHDNPRRLFRTIPNIRSLILSPRDIRLVASNLVVLRVERLLPKLTHLALGVGRASGVPAIESVRAAVDLLDARSTATASTARIEHADLADWTQWNESEGKFKFPKMDPIELDVELSRLLELKARDMSIRWWRKGIDLLIPRMIR